jgi:hypothetical protein
MDLFMSTLMKKLRIEEDKLNLEQENSNGEFMKMKAVFEKRIQLYIKFLAEDNLTELERLTLSNKKEWQMAHLLGLIIQQENTNKFSELTKRVYNLEKKVVQIEERIMS